jgi:hypothetical protein
LMLLKVKFLNEKLLMVNSAL